MVDWSPTFFSDMSPVTCYGTDFPSTNGDVLLMQYTGMKDCAGREIYEGDIISDIDMPTGVVTWEDNLGWWFVKDDHNDDFLQEYTIDGKVIGNIYEGAAK